MYYKSMGFVALDKISLILTFCAVIGLFLAASNQPPVIGYILTGIALGPHMLKLITETEPIRIIGDFGMILMLFTVGLKLDVYEFKKVWKTSLICVFVQILSSFLAAKLLGSLLGMDTGMTALFTCFFALSSTAVAVKLLENKNEVNNQVGSLVISILIAQDLALAPMIITLKSIIFKSSIYVLFSKLFFSLFIMIVCVIFVSRSNLKFLNKFFNSAFLKNPEINALATIAICFGFAQVSELVGLSGVYGAFICGFILGNLGPKNALLSFSMPLSGILMMSFFVYIGTLFDTVFIAKNIFNILAVVIFITLFKILINYVVLINLKWRRIHSMLASALLSQVSEFSFVLLSLYSTSENFICLKNWIVSVTVVSLSVGSIIVIMIQDFLERS
ncbi:cation:proton antiporter [Candidatus Nesciobacter abundans]|uniref:Cation/H+ exchanger transmembrane domain-containing protein n=1 Tax=Candidatus Nesciobacter abundans TaxID=2601668 RepID=A0A5C0UK70_9PROT|nr:cation:proton antiporter [Candidatus Nesciobacter abundans]QEK39254.1 hypothetical protein FZC36_02370 [Candidatus Nesciobacter abundans]